MGHTLALEASATWRILVASIILGAGLPALFAVGIRAMAYGAGGDAEVTGSHAASGAASSAQPHPIGRVLGIICFAVVVLCVVLGLVFIVATGFGKALSFEHIYPTIVPKS